VAGQGCGFAQGRDAAGIVFERALDIPDGPGRREQMLGPGGLGAELAERTRQSRGAGRAGDPDRAVLGGQHVNEPAQAGVAGPAQDLQLARGGPVLGQAIGQEDEDTILFGGQERDLAKGAGQVGFSFEPDFGDRMPNPLVVGELHQTVGIDRPDSPGAAFIDAVVAFAGGGDMADGIAIEEADGVDLAMLDPEIAAGRHGDRGGDGLREPISGFVDAPIGFARHFSGADRTEQNAEAERGEERARRAWRAGGVSNPGPHSSLFAESECPVHHRGVPLSVNFFSF